MFSLISSYIRNFGLVTTWRVLLWPKIVSVITHEQLFVINRSSVRKFVYLQLRDTILKYSKQQISKGSPIEEDCPIWICWWQGKEHMPDLAKLCMRYVEKNKGQHKIIFVDQDNFQQYVTLPDFLLERLEKGKISITHFTDVLRFALLQKYGGIWLDALIMMVSPLNISNLYFYTNKNIPKNNNYVSQCRWTGGVLACGKNNPLVSFVYESYVSYWKKNQIAIDYMLMDYIIDIGYEEVGSIREMIDEVDYNNPNFYILKSMFNQAVDIPVINSIYQGTELLSLNRRILCEETTPSGELTYYGYFKKKIYEER